MRSGVAADAELVPDHLYQALLNYVSKGWQPGGFLTACLENNLMDAVKYADPISMGAIPHVVAWIYTYAPIACHGSEDKVRQWADSDEFKRARRLSATRKALTGDELEKGAA